MGVLMMQKWGSVRASTREVGGWEEDIHTNAGTTKTLNSGLPRRAVSCEQAVKPATGTKIKTKTLT